MSKYVASAINGLTRATYEVARTNEDIARSNREIVEAVNKGRIEIPNSRYAELRNKGMLLSNILGWLDNYLQAIFLFSQDDKYHEWFNNSALMSPTSMNTGVIKKPVYVDQKGECTFIVDPENEVVQILLNDEPYPFETPDYVPSEDGNMNLNIDEYNDLLTKEKRLEKYIELMDNIDNFFYRMTTLRKDTFKSQVAGSFYKFVRYPKNEGIGMGPMDATIKFNTEFLLDIRNPKYKLLLKQRLGKQSLQLRLI